MNHNQSFENSLLKWYREHELDNYNPWLNEKAGANAIQQFIAQDEDFSWIKHETKEYRPSTKFIIPTHTQGNIETATLFQCLYNPGVEEAIWELNDKNLKDFIESAKAKEKDILYIDIGKMYTDIGSPEKVKEKILQQDSILSQELRSIYQKHLQDPFASAKRLKEYVRANCYYINHYYKPILNKLLETPKTSQIDGAVDYLFLNLPNLEALALNLEGKICNLEYIPFASKTQKDCKVTKDSKEFINYTVAIILFRIAKYLNDREATKPIFIFRSTNLWLKSIKDFIKTEIGYYFDDIEKFFKSGYFYEFKSRNANISEKNIRKIGSSSTIDEFDTVLNLFKVNKEKK